MPSNIVTDLIQICLVTEHFEDTVNRLATTLGIGPWKCWDYVPPQIFATRRDDQPAAWTMKLGVAWVGAVQLEVIQPLAGDTIYREYLEAQGEGAQHLLVGTAPGYFEAIKQFEAAGHRAAQSARINPAMLIGGLTIPAPPRFIANRIAVQFTYHDTRAALGTVLEISKMPPGIPFRLGIRLGKPDVWVPADSRDVEASLPNRMIEAITKVGIVVDDLESTIANWQGLGVTPWEYREVPGARLACAKLGGVTLELAQPTGEGIYGELRARGTGIQYLGVRTLGKLDFPVLAEVGGEKFLDTREAAKTVLVIA